MSIMFYKRSFNTSAIPSVLPSILGFAYVIAVMEGGDLILSFFHFLCIWTTVRQSFMEVCTFIMHRRERVVWTYLAALGRAVVKGLNILYLVGYSFSP
jgi:hypothetical protein